jgi:thiamine pyrophosphate-dependent acetolactate synthase large subunit-like protein
MANTVGRLIIDSLEAHDIDLVYCVPGESAEALSTKGQPVVVPVHSSLEQISAWRRRS